MSRKLSIKSIYKHLPNTLTSLNLFCGSLSILFAIQGELLQAAYLLLIAYHFDIFDGLAARLLKVQSEIGKELDSLADVISFGLGPAAILFGLLKPELDIDTVTLFPSDLREYLIFIPFILPVFAALRLAKFNLDVSKSSNFIGLPTPANALMVLSIPLIANHHPDSFIVEAFTSIEGILIYSIIVSFLMVSPLPLYSLKLKGFSWSVNKYTYIFLMIVLLTLVSFGYTGLFLIVVFYFIYGHGLALFLKRKNS